MEEDLDRPADGGERGIDGRLILGRERQNPLVQTSQSGAVLLSLVHLHRWEPVELRTQRADSISAFIH